MTREEAIKILKYQHDNGNMEEAVRQALAMAIEALTQDSRKVTQESTQDLISRADLFNELATVKASPEANKYKAEVYGVIQNLPSAEPKTGKWEEVEDYNGDVHYKCNKCGVEWIFPSGTPIENNANFCPKCGADMRGEEE